MKKLALVASLILGVLLIGNTKTQAAEQSGINKNSHHGRGSHGKKDGHRRGIHLFHRHGHQQDHSRPSGHSHGHRGQKGTNESQSEKDK